MKKMEGRPNLTRVLFAATLTCLPALASADELHLKNGDRITGRLVSLTPDLCVFETPYAATLRVEPVNVSRLTTTEPVVFNLNGGDRLIGTIDALGQGRLFIKSERFGDLTLSLEEVAEVSRDLDAPRTAAAPPALSPPEASPSAAAEPPVPAPRTVVAVPAEPPRSVVAVPAEPPRSIAARPAEPPRSSAAPAPAQPSRPAVQAPTPPARSGVVAGPVTVPARGDHTEDPRLLRMRGRGSNPAQVAQETQEPGTPPENGTGQQNGNGQVPPEERFGQEQREDEQREQIFLRRETVLLAPGEFQGEASLTYLRDRDERTQNVRREVSLVPSLRAGLLITGLEGSISLPITWAQREFLAGTSQATLRTETTDSFGIGDLRANLKYQVVREHGLWPDIIASVGFRAPTGEEPDPRDANAVAIGGGRWETSATLTFVRTFDPAVLFGSIGYTHLFDADIRGVEYSGGSGIDYSFGLGFAINDQITLSGQFFGAYQNEVDVNNRTIPLSSREPMSLRSSLTYRFSRNQYIEPSIIYGINDDATDTVIGLSFVRQF